MSPRGPLTPHPPPIRHVFRIWQIFRRSTFLSLAPNDSCWRCLLRPSCPHPVGGASQVQHGAEAGQHDRAGPGLFWSQITFQSFFKIGQQGGGGNYAVRIFLYVSAFFCLIAFPRIFLSLGFSCPRQFPLPNNVPLPVFYHVRNLGPPRGGVLSGKAFIFLLDDCYFTLRKRGRCTIFAPKNRNPQGLSNPK